MSDSLRNFFFHEWIPSKRKIPSLKNPSRKKHSEKIFKSESLRKLKESERKSLQIWNFFRFGSLQIWMNPFEVAKIMKDLKDRESPYKRFKTASASKLVFIFCCCGESSKCNFFADLFWKIFLELKFTVFETHT